jgi:hypothetical protein
VSIPLHGKDAISVIPCFRGGHVQFYSVDEECEKIDGMKGNLVKT